MTNNIHPKVFSATIGAGVGGTVSAFALWLLGITIWHSPATSAAAEQAIAAVPAPVAGITVLALTVGGAFGLGWLAKSAPTAYDALQDWQDGNQAIDQAGNLQGSEPVNVADLEGVSDDGIVVADPTEAA